MKWHSFRVRLSLWNISILAVALIGFGATMAYAVQANVSMAVNRELDNRVRVFEAEHFNWRGGPPGPPPGGFRARHDDFRGHRPDEHDGDRHRGPEPRGGFGRGPGPGPDWMQNLTAEERWSLRLGRPNILGTDGHEEHHFGPGSQGADDGPFDPKSYTLSLAGQRVYSNIVLNGHQVRVLSIPHLRGSDMVGVVQVAQDLGALERLRKTLFGTMLMVIPLVLLVAGTGGLFLTGRALQPVRAITETAAEISAHDLSRRLVVRGKDELAELATTINGMLARLEGAFHDQQRAYEQLRRFTADVSHELRTPLARLKGITSLTLSFQRPAEAYREALEVADHAADAMTRLVQDLLLLARSDSGQLRLQTRAMPISSVLLEAADTVPPAEDVQVVLNLPEDAPVIECDPAHLTRLFVNLLENAIRHTPTGGKVTLTAGRRGDRAFATVSDTGCGIPPEHLEHLFERFYRVDDARDRARGGTGLGLAMCKSIAEAHGGTLHVQSEVGRGTTVTAEFPLASATAKASPDTPALASSAR